MKKNDRDAIRNALWHMQELANTATKIEDPYNYYGGVEDGLGKALDLVEDWPVDDEDEEENDEK